MAQIWQLSPGLYRGSIQSVVEDRPTLQWLAGRGIRLELSGQDATWIVVLTTDECKHIAEAIGWHPHDDWPPRGDE